MRATIQSLLILFMQGTLIPAQTALFTNAHIYQRPGADAILCADGKILSIGKGEDFTADEVVDLQGGYVYPGFTDSHMHLLGLGQALEILDLVGTTSAQEIAQKVQDKLVEIQPGEWVIGRGWDQNDWPDTHFPTKELLDSVAPQNPVYLRRIDGHAAWVNSQVLKLANINAQTPDPPGGKIVRDEKGEPTGILIDNAVDLVEKKLPPSMPKDRRRQITKAMRLLNSFGLTSIHDAGTTPETIATLKELLAEERLTVRVYAMLSDTPENTAPYLTSGPDTTNSFLVIRAVKLYLDGALGSRGAALLQPYNDDPANRGLILTDSVEVARRVKEYNQAGFQVGIHCIGDRANRMALDIYETNGIRSRRNRIEHAQIIHPTDIPRFVALKVIPAMQATHCTSDMYWADERLGPERLIEAYPWQSLIQTGAIIPNGSDAPVESPDPLAGLYAATTRQDQKGWPAGGWRPEERMTIATAIKSFTEWPAYASFAEQHKGKIAPGYYADFTVLNKDLLTIPPKEILSTEVTFTIVNGVVVYSQ
jgi:hypothetical protein